MKYFRSEARRRSVAAAGPIAVLIALAGLTLPWEWASAAEVDGRYFRMSFDPKGGTYDIGLKDGAPLVRAARLEAEIADRILSSADRSWRSSTDTGRFRDNLGPGRSLTVRFEPTDGGPLEMTLVLRCYDDRRLATVEAVVRNRSDNDLPLRELRPLVAGKTDGGLYFAREIDGLRLLTHGYAFWDCGDLYELRDERLETIANWNLALFDPRRPMGLTVGCLKFDETETQIVIGREPSSPAVDDLAGLYLRVVCSTNRKRDAMGRYFKTETRTVLPTGWGRNYEKPGWIEAEADIHHEYLLPPGGSIGSGPIALILDPSPHRSLELWAEAVRVLNDIKLDKPAPAGWCSWPDMYYNVNEVKMLRIAETAARERLDDFGFRIIQMDDGFQERYGDWEGNLYFPRGMKWLAEEIGKRGFTPGIWVAPYGISIDHEIALNHRDWLYEGADGSVRDLQFYIGIPIYGLDITVDPARQWVAGLFRTLAADWGYRFFKLDYIGDTVLDAIRYHDPHLTKAQAYRSGLAAIREAVGPDSFVLECGAVSAAGLCDSWRANADIGASWRELTMERGTGHAIPKRYYLHGNLFLNDPDHLVVRAPLTLNQARALATNVAMSGGQVLAGDALYDLPEERLRIIKQVLPPYGRAARTIDLFDTNFPGIYLLNIERDFEKWSVLAAVNWEEDRPVKRTIELARLGLDPEAQYLAFEFWNQEFLGAVRGKIELFLEPSSAKIVSLRPRLDYPQVIGTDRHVTQGAVELDRVRWNEPESTLSGSFKGARDHTFSLVVHCPSGYEPAGAAAGNGAAMAIETIGDGLLRASLKFGDRAVRDFSIRFRRR